MKDAIWVLHNVLLQLIAAARDWAAKWLKRVLLILLAALVLAAGVRFAVRAVRLAIARARMEEAACVRIVYFSEGIDWSETEYDLSERVLRTFNGDYDHRVRDPEAENGGWTGIEPLTEEQIAEIRRACAPILLWKEHYPDYTMHAMAWHITITFRDGSAHGSIGSNTRPKDYDRVMAALSEARQAE